MKISYIYDEGPRKEDSYLIKDNLVGVFDGANSRTNFVDQQGLSGGQLAAQIVKDTFALNDRPLKDLATLANQNLKSQMVAHGVDTNDKLNCWHSAFAVVRIQDKFFEWAQICDCLILVIYQNGDFKLLVNDYDHDAEALRFLQQLAQRGEKDPRAMLERGPFLQIWQDANKTYGVLDGDENFISFLNFGSEILDDVSHILIFSDGLFIPRTDLSQPDDFQTLVRLFLEGGLNNVKEFVRDLENSDPECKKYLRLKQHDDITAIAISF